MQSDPSKKQFADRLIKAMQDAGYTAKPAVLEREFNRRYWGKPMTLHGVRRWLLGETLPSQDKLLVLAEWLGIPPHVLRFGEEVTARIEARNARWDSGIGYQEREIFEAFLQLPIPARKTVREVIVAFAKAYPVQG